MASDETRLIKLETQFSEFLGRYERDRSEQKTILDKIEAKLDMLKDGQANLKNEKGEASYRVLIWFGSIVGAIVIGYVFTRLQIKP